MRNFRFFSCLLGYTWCTHSHLYTKYQYLVASEILVVNIHHYWSRVASMVCITGHKIYFFNAQNINLIAKNFPATILLQISVE